VLVVDSPNGQARSALAAVRALAAGGWRAVVATSARCSLAAASRHAIGVVNVPPTYDDTFVSAVRVELARSHHAGVLAATDTALVALGLPGAALVDKRAHDRLARAAGLELPPTEVFADVTALRASANSLAYPVVVKPAVSTAPARRVDTPGGLGELSYDGAVLVQPFLTDGLRAIAGVRWQGTILAAVQQRYLRTWPVDCGTAAAAETVTVDEELLAGVNAALDDYDGVFQLQLAGRYVLDLNPRIYGSLPLAVAADANLPAIWAAAMTGARVPPVRGRPGVRYRWIEGDLRHLVTTARRRARPALWQLLPRRGTAHSTESLSDPRPMARRLQHAVGRCG
jgi:hypothetical protein